MSCRAGGGAAITQITRQLGISRSAWLRQIIDEAIANQTPGNPHARYQELMNDMVPMPHAPAQGARQHGQVLKEMLQAKRQASA